MPPGQNPGHPESAESGTPNRIRRIRDTQNLPIGRTHQIQNTRIAPVGRTLVLRQFTALRTYLGD